MSLNSSPRASAVGFCCSLLFGITVTVLCALGYHRLPMPDLGRFHLFIALTLTAAAGTVWTTFGAIFQRLSPPNRAPLAIALGTGLPATVAMAGWSLTILGRSDRPIEMIAIAIASAGLGLGLGILAWILSRSGISRKRFGLPGLILASALAFFLFQT